MMASCDINLVTINSTISGPPASPSNVSGGRIPLSSHISLLKVFFSSPVFLTYCHPAGRLLD